MKTFYTLTASILLLFCSVTAFADVTLSSVPVPAANMLQGSSGNILYIVKADVSSSPISVSRIQFTLSGTHDADDLGIINVYYNASAPSLSGASIMVINASAAFAAPHAYDLFFNIPGSQTIAAGSSGYFIITTNVNSTATNGNTVKINGAVSPVGFTYSTAPTINNLQTDVAGTQTIQAGAISFSTISSPAVNVTQGSSNNIVYIVKADATVAPVTLNYIQFTLDGTYDNDDITSLNVYYNATAPTLSGSSLTVVNASGAFSPPHAYDLFFNIPGSQTIAPGGSGYFIITASLSNTATGGHTIKINGAANPVTFSYTAAPTVTNSQTDLGGALTILAPNVTYTTISTPAVNVTQGSTNNVVYIVKADVTGAAVTVSRIQFTLTGTHDNDDLDNLNLYYNPTAPTLSGSTRMSVDNSANFAAPHAYDMFFGFTGSQTIAAGSSGYFILVESVNTLATGGHTIKLNGAANPVTFTYSGAPTVTNNQTDLAGAQTIIAAAVSLSSIAVPASNMAQSSLNNIVYIVKADVTGVPVVFNHIQFTLNGTHDADDFTNLNVYFNPTAPTLAGSNTLIINNTLFNAPHSYDLFFNIAGTQTIAAGSSGYFIITVSLSNTATNGNTIKINGAANPVTFTYTTAPTVTNTQTDVAGTQTILSGAITLSTIAVPAQNIAQASTNNIVYIVKADVTSLPVSVNHIQFTLLGTHDNDDLGVINVYFNPTAPTLAGSNTLIMNLPANFAAPHAYDLFFNIAGNQTIAAGNSGYFIITVSVSNTATIGNTIRVNGAANPVTFTYTTAPTITNTQSDIAQAQTIRAVGITLSTVPMADRDMLQSSSPNILYAVKADVTSFPVTISRIQFTLTGSIDNNDLTLLHVYYNPSAPTTTGAAIVLTMNNPATFAAPHTYDLLFNNPGSLTIAAGNSGYFIIAAAVDPNATVGNTVKINGATNPVTFTYTTAPTITDMQTDVAGVSTVRALVPLTLVDFKGTRVDTKNIQLTWTTASELNTKDFDVEWSADGSSFTKIGTLPAAGYSSQLRQYNYTDNDRIAGNNYYRLKISDNDGQFTYSRIIKITGSAQSVEILAFPNPFVKDLQLEIQSLQNKTVVFNLSDAAGKRIASKTYTLIKGDNRLIWDLPNLPSGNYFISSNDKTFKAVEVRRL